MSIIRGQDLMCAYATGTVVTSAPATGLTWFGIVQSEGVQESNEKKEYFSIGQKNRVASRAGNYSASLSLSFEANSDTLLNLLIDQDNYWGVAVGKRTEGIIGVAGKVNSLKLSASKEEAGITAEADFGFRWFETSSNATSSNFTTGTVIFALREGTITIAGDADTLVQSFSVTVDNAVTPLYDGTTAAKRRCPSDFYNGPQTFTLELTTDEPSALREVMTTNCLAGDGDVVITLVDSCVSPSQTMTITCVNILQEGKSFQGSAGGEKASTTLSYSFDSITIATT